MTRRCTQREVIERFQEVHGTEKYDYSEVEYVNTKTRVKIWCNTCSGYFWQAPGVHKTGCGCPTCGIKKRSNIRRLTTEQIVKHFQIVHGEDKYDYSSVDYKGIEDVIHGDNVILIHNPGFDISPLEKIKGLRTFSLTRESNTLGAYLVGIKPGEDLNLSQTKFVYSMGGHIKAFKA